jgi:L-phenylalanine/L-methionine N-acetyltransferase
MTELIIRAVEPRDITQIRDLYADTTAYADTLQLPYPTLANWERRFAHPREGRHALVAVRGDEVLGQITLEAHSRARRRHVATMGLGVKASARGQGVGSAMLDAAIALAEKWLAITRIEIEVYTDNAAGIALYRKHGFVIEGTCKHYAFRDGRYVDAHVMARLATLA